MIYTDRNAVKNQQSHSQTFVIFFLVIHSQSTILSTICGCIWHAIKLLLLLCFYLVGPDRIMTILLFVIISLTHINRMNITIFTISDFFPRLFPLDPKLNVIN